MGPSVHDYDKYNVASEKPTDNILYLKDVLFTLKMSKSTLYNKVSAGVVPKPAGKWIGKSYWFKSDIDAFLRNQFGITR